MCSGERSPPADFGEWERLERQHELAPGRCGRGNGGGVGMPEDHPERHEARLSQPFVLFAPDLRSVCPRALLERLRRFPLLAVSLEEDPMTGVPSPCVPPRGSWRTPAATPVKGRSSRPGGWGLNHRRRSHHPATAAVATSRTALPRSNHSSMAAQTRSRLANPRPRRSPTFFPRPLGALSHNNNRGAHVPSDSQKER